MDVILKHFEKHINSKGACLIQTRSFPLKLSMEKAQGQRGATLLTVGATRADGAVDACWGAHRAGEGDTEDVWAMGSPIGTVHP